MALASGDLDQYWAIVAEKLNDISEEDERIFLAKLILLLGNALGDLPSLRQLVAQAAADLESEPRQRVVGG
jgi:hypothetical protein